MKSAQSVFYVSLYPSGQRNPLYFGELGRGVISEIEKESFEQWPFWPTVKSIFSCGNKLFIARETTFISAVEKHHYLFPGWKWPQKWNKCIYLKLPYYQFVSCPWCRREEWVVPIITCWVTVNADSCWSQWHPCPPQTVVEGGAEFHTKEPSVSRHLSPLPRFHWLLEFLLPFH